MQHARQDFIVDAARVAQPDQCFPLGASISNRNLR